MERIHSAMAELAVAVKIILCPNNGDFPVFQYFRVPDPFQPGIFTRAYAFYEFLVRRGRGCAVRMHGEEHRLRSEKRLGISRIVRGHVVKEALGHRKRSSRAGSSTAG